MSKRKHPISGVNIHHQAQDRLVYGGLLGINAVAVIQMLGIEAIDRSLQIAIILSAVALPLLAFLVVLLTIEDQFKHAITSWPVRIAKMFTPLISFLAFAAMFFHYSPLAGVAFLFVSGAATAAFIIYYDVLVKLGSADVHEDVQAQETES